MVEWRRGKVVESEEEGSYFGEDGGGGGAGKWRMRENIKERRK